MLNIHINSISHIQLDEYNRVRESTDQRCFQAENRNI